MSYTVKVTRGQNGYKLEWRDEEGPEGRKEDYIQDDDYDELKSGIELLWWIMEFFGLLGSKHDPERIRIIREKKEKFGNE